MIVPFLRHQSDLNDDLRVRMRDVAKSRWSDAVLYRLISDTVQGWGDRVTVPHLYTLPDGFGDSEFEYSIPNYVRPPFDVQWQRTLPGLIDFADQLVTQWVTVPGLRLEPDGAGGTLLRLEQVPYSTNARILFRAPNGGLPSSPPTLASAPTAASTSITITGFPEIADVGYIQIDGEYMQYAGVTRTATETILLNLIRGVNGTTADSHSGGTTIYWCVALPEQQLIQPLYDGTMARMHEMYLLDASGQDRAQHFDYARYHRQLEQEGLERRTRRPGRMILDERAFA